MPQQSFGELIPVGGGDSIPLRKKNLVVGRREGCDIVLRFPNVSSTHCELTCIDGYWHVRDLNSSNGIKVNGQRVQDKFILPGDELTVAKHKYKVQYSPVDLGAVGPPPTDGNIAEIFSRSLLESAGLERDNKLSDRSKDKTPRRYDVMNDKAGQIKQPGKPV